MIPIQVPEELKRMLSMEFDRQRNIHNHNTGKYTELVEMIDRLLNEEDKSKIDFHRAAVEEIYANTARSQEIKEIREELQKVQDEASGSMIKMYLAEGGMNSMTHLIKNENLELEPITLESITRLEYIEKNEPVPEEVPA